MERRRHHGRREVSCALQPAVLACSVVLMTSGERVLLRGGVPGCAERETDIDRDAMMAS